MRITVETHINIPKNLSKVQNKDFWTFSLNEWHRLLSPYVPFQTGNLDETVKIKAEAFGGEIEYFSPYSHYIYEGRLMIDPKTGSSWAEAGSKKVYADKDLVFSKARHPLATAHWDKAAEPEQKPKLINAMQGFVDSGRLNLSE